MFSLFGRNKKYAFGAFLMMFFASSVFSAVFPGKAYAILGAGDVTLSTDVTNPYQLNQQQYLHTSDKVELTLGKAVVASTLSAAISAVNYYAQTVAYEAAVYIASGDKGQDSLIFKKGWGDFLTDTALDAVGAAISDFGASWGFNFCRFPNANLQWFLDIGIRRLDKPTTDCTWNDFKTTLGQYKSLYNDTKDFVDGKHAADVDKAITRQFIQNIHVNHTDFGIAAGALIQVDNVKIQKQQAAYAERSTNKGFKDLGSIISGNVMTPGEVIGEESKKQLSRTRKEDQQWSTLGSVYASGAYEIIPSTVAMFINTLINTTVDRYLPGNPDEGNYTDPEVVYNSDSSGSSYYFDKLEAAKSAFGYLKAVAPQAQKNEYDTLLAEMASCPENPGTNNCVMDASLQSALSISDGNSQSLTIREALKAGYLHGDWRLISPRRSSEHESIKGCVTDKYCYSNIQKMRKARILPLGFEVAALRSDPDAPWTLQAVVDGFDKCDYIEGTTTTLANPAFPFCHLINPNWILKLPTYRCDALVYGDNLTFDGSPERKQECADLSTCLSFNENGSCKGWGYCTKEKNTWDIQVDHCPAEFNTCTTFTNDETKKLVSYLGKTVDYGQCNADNTGCRAYSLEAEVNPVTGTTTWQTSLQTGTPGAIAQKLFGETQTAYFNYKIKDLSNVCSANNDGCSAFWQAQILPDGRYIDQDSASISTEFGRDTSVDYAYLKKAPDYLGCYDRDVEAPGVQWPNTTLEASTAVASNAACENFASACVAEEVGCESFIPQAVDSQGNKVADGPSIPGKIGPQNFCDASCAGYQTFKQEASEFEPSKFPVSFIGSQADECPVEAVGCSEFTNIDALSQGGESLEYYTHIEYCEKPLADNSNIATYYSWEGSANTGYNIITHRLRPLTAVEAATIAIETNNLAGFPVASPAYVLNAPEALRRYHSKCNEASYNILLAGGPLASGAADTSCRALFDNAGHTYYRLTDSTVKVDASCHPLRKTEAVFERETRPYLDQVTCENNHDRWNVPAAGPAFCERCINGGKFENGFCVYQTISRPDVSTSCTGPEGNEAAYNGCRDYTGNASGNIEDIIRLDDFEPGTEVASAYVEAARPWRAQSSVSTVPRVVKEATINGKHSLQVAGDATLVRDIPTEALETNQWYEISFVAKSLLTTTPLFIHFDQPVSNQIFSRGSFSTRATPVNVGPGWQVYKLGPIQYTGHRPEPLFLTFERTSGNGVYFIDQFRMRKIANMKHYIKDSWKNKNGGKEVPEICDSAPEDGLPGEALGCQEYKDSNDTSRYVVGFESLCREKAIGCKPVWDTYNTLDGAGAEQSQVFNALCFGLANTPCKVMYDGAELGNCFVPRGETSCHVPKIVIPQGLTWTMFKTQMQTANNNILKVDIDASSIITLADTSDVAPIFLASGEKHKYSCERGSVGCQRSGREAKYLPTNSNAAFQFSDFFVKNDPDKYVDTLCRNDLVGCSKYRDGAKETYFKDPVITGNSLCEYKAPQENQDGTYGWFLQGVGKCTGNNNLCKSNSDCGQDPNGNAVVCRQIDVACAEDHLVGDGLYDIWSNETVGRYDGNVGICPANWNQCRELIDRQDTSAVNPEGKPYYVIFNNKVEQKMGGTACPSNQVSLTEGCVLFDKTDEPNKLYDSAATYVRSEKKPGNPFGLVPAVGPNDNFEFHKADSNLVLKVNRSRECSEWLSCNSKTLVKKEDGSYDYVCEKLSLCEKLGKNPEECGKSVDPLADTVEGEEDLNLVLNRLTNEKYVTRKVSWFDEEFSGYSLYNHFQIGNLIYIYFKFPKEIEESITNKNILNHSYLVRNLSQDLFQANDGLDKDCYDPNQPQKDWDICGFDDGGRCYNTYCLYPTNGVFSDTEVVDDNLIIKDPHALTAQERIDMVAQISTIIDRLEPDQCKSAPESGSPFPSTVLENESDLPRAVNGMSRHLNTDTKPGFESVNFCQFGECACNYQKITYKNAVVDYWPLQIGPETTGDTRIPTGVCVGGPKDGYACSPSDVPNICDAEGGVKFECAPQARVDQFIGYSGYCLEYDLGRPNPYNNKYPCLTWLPVQGSVSPVDLYNAEEDAGYNPNVDGKVDDTDVLVGGVAYCTEGTIVKNPEDTALVEEFRKYYDLPRIRYDVNHDVDDVVDFDTVPDAVTFAIADIAFPPGDIESCVPIQVGNTPNSEVGRVSSVFAFQSKFQATFCSVSLDNFGSDQLYRDVPDQTTKTFLTSYITHITHDDSAQLLRMESGLRPQLTSYGNTASDGGYAAFFGNAEDITNCGNRPGIPCTPYSFAPAYSNKVKDGGPYTNLGPVIHPPRLFGLHLRDLSVVTCLGAATTTNNHLALELCDGTAQPFETSINNQYSIPADADGYNYAPAGMCGTDYNNGPVSAEATAIWGTPVILDPVGKTEVGEYLEGRARSCMERAGSTGRSCALGFSLSEFGDLLNWCDNPDQQFSLNDILQLGPDEHTYVPKGLCDIDKIGEDELSAENQAFWQNVLQVEESRTRLFSRNIWDQAREAVDACITNEQNHGQGGFGSLYSYDSSLPQASNISPMFMSPEVEDYLPQDGDASRAVDVMSDQGILPTGFERDLNLNEVKRVYFLPTGYPDGPEGSLPALMETGQMYLDFAAIDAEGTKAIDAKITSSELSAGNDKFFAMADESGVSGVGHIYSGLMTNVRSPEDLRLNPEGEFQTILEQSEELRIRNIIVKRYYLLYLPPDAPPGSLIPDGEDVHTDYFSRDAGCAVNNGSNGTFFAVGMDFNVYGEFLGYVSNWCMGKGNGGSMGIQFAVVATFNNTCTEISKVYDTTRSGFTSRMRKDSNKAWTNRVFRYAFNGSPNAQGVESLGIERKTDEMPFGSLNLRDSGEGVGLDIQGSYVNQLSYAFRNVEPKGGDQVRGGEGLPFSCTGGDCTNLGVTADSVAKYPDTAIHDLSGATKTKENAYKFLHQLFAKEYLRINIGQVGTVVQCVARVGHGLITFAYQNCDDGRNNSDQQHALVAQEFSVGDEAVGITCDGVISADERTYGQQVADCVNLPNRVSDTMLDFANVRTSRNESGERLNLMPPQIYSVQPYTCLVAKQETCTAWEKDSFTIGERNGSLGDYDGDGRDDEDQNGDGTPDPLVIFGNIYYAKMKFFAFADDNRMPIRRIKLDWGDGSAADLLDKRGLYKNRKPVCETDDGVDASAANIPEWSVCMETTMLAGIPQNNPTGIPCINAADASDSQPTVACPLNQYCLSRAQLQDLGPEYSDVKRFGNLDRACEPKYFEYSHQYTCSSAQVDDYRVRNFEDDTIMKISNPKLSAYRAQLGSLPGVDYVCAFKPKVQALDNWGWCNGSCSKQYVNGIPQDDTPDNSYGCYSEFPRNGHPLTNQCDDLQPNVNPWTEYKQYIIMVPLRD